MLSNRTKKFFNQNSFECIFVFLVLHTSSLWSICKQTANVNIVRSFPTFSLITLSSGSLVKRAVLLLLLLLLYFCLLHFLGVLDNLTSLEVLSMSGNQLEDKIFFEAGHTLGKWNCLLVHHFLAFNLSWNHGSLCTLHEFLLFFIFLFFLPF